MNILDYSGVASASVVMAIKQFGQELNENIVKHMLLNSIRRLNLKFKRKYGEMVIACDARSYWRYEEFKYYKYKRKVDRAKARQEDDVDWDQIFIWVNELVDDLDKYFPYTVIKVDKAEADDIIGALVTEYEHKEKILIISKDKDFKQLHSRNVHQYDPIGDKVMRAENPKLFLSEHIITGDAGDGIPNIRSPIDTFYTGTRQKACGPKTYQTWVGEAPETFCDTPEMLERYYQNEKLINLRMVPEFIYSEVIEKYKAGTEIKNDKIFTYLVKNKMRNLIESMQDFHNECNRNPNQEGIF